MGTKLYKGKSWEGLEELSQEDRAQLVKQNEANKENYDKIQGNNKPLSENTKDVTRELRKSGIKYKVKK